MEESVPTASLDAVLERPGGQIGHYKLICVLGEGGMGIVYLAEQQEPIRRKVALKVIKPGMDSKRVMARFEAERQALALLDHPNIAHVYGAGTTEAGRPYFVMEFVKGLPITEHCDHHKLTIEERLRLFQQVCQAVQHAHQKGIIHRDIKPSNLLVSTQDDNAVPKIIDFGVAKAISMPLTERTLATEDSQLLGTPEYMSPEQADMATEDIDTRSDVYSLGVLLYVLLTGALPFDSDTLREGGIENIRKTIRDTDPKTPSTRLAKLGDEARKLAENRCMEIHTLARHLKKELEWIPMKAMRKDRSERYRSASELADDIENYLNGEPLIAGPPGTGYRLKKFVRRNRVLCAAVLAIALALLLGMVATTAMYFRAERQARISEAVSSFLRDDLILSVSPTRTMGREVTVRSLLDTVSENLEAKFKDEPLVEASIRDTLGYTYRILADFGKAEVHLNRAIQLHQEHLGFEDPKTLKSMSGLVWVYLSQGRFVEAEKLAAKALRISRRLFNEEHEEILRHTNDLAFAYMTLGRYEEAESLYVKILETNRIVSDREGGKTTSAMNNLAHVYLMQGRYNEAEQQYDRALELAQRTWGSEHPSTLVNMSVLANVYASQGRYGEAEQLYGKTLEALSRVVGEDHEYMLVCMNKFARLHTMQEHYGQAEDMFNKALEIGRRRL
ncbi:MAG: serine/threonine protein kinase, partial [Planctomycetota bacterium]